MTQDIDRASQNLSEQAAKSERAFQNILNDSTLLTKRVETYKSNQPAGVSRSEHHLSGHLSVIEGLGSPNIRKYASQQQINALVDSMHQNMSPVVKSIPEKQYQDKMTLNVAKTEAALKGFALPLNLGGDSDGLKNFGLKQAEYPAAMAATKTAILEASGQKIPQAEFGERIVARTREILKNEGHDNDKLEKFTKFVSQGIVVDKKMNLTPAQEAKLKTETGRAVNDLTKSLKKDTKAAQLSYDRATQVAQATKAFESSNRHSSAAQTPNPNSQQIDKKKTKSSAASKMLKKSNDAIKYAANHPGALKYTTVPTATAIIASKVIPKEVKTNSVSAAAKLIPKELQKTWKDSVASSKESKKSNTSIGQNNRNSRGSGKYNSR